MHSQDSDAGVGPGPGPTLCGHRTRDPVSKQQPASIDALVMKLVNEERLPRSSPHDCPYLDDLEAVEEGFMVERLRPETYHELMNLGFRRSGQVFYRPRCENCSKCTQLRVPTEDFKRSKSQRRTWNKNKDVTAEVGPPVLTDEKYDIYRRYLAHQHPDSRQTDDREGLRNFLYTTSVDTMEVRYRLDDGDEEGEESGRLIALSLLDVSSRSLSSVYHFFDPRERKRSLGVYSVLYEVELGRRWGIPWYYLGYWVEGAPTMKYKANYYPHEILVDGEWQRRHKK